jgi:aquaporin NIP
MTHTHRLVAEAIGSFGLIIIAMIYATGHISGTHSNLAVTLAFAGIRHLPWSLTIRHWGAQLAGGVVAGLVLCGDLAHLGTTLPLGFDSPAFVLEIILTFFMIVIMAVATDTLPGGQAAAIAIGGTVGLEAIFADPVSGASMNPARSLAPTHVSWTWQSRWL